MPWHGSFGNETILNGQTEKDFILSKYTIFMVKIDILLPFLESLAKTTATDRKPNIKLPTLKICFIVVPTLVLH